MPGPVKLPLRHDHHVAVPRPGAVALHVHEALAVDDADLRAAFQHPLHHLPTGEVLPRASGEQGDYPAARLDMTAEDGEETDASVVVGEAGKDVERAFSRLLLPDPDALEKRDQPPAAARRIDVGMDRELVQGLARTTRVSARTALLAW